MRTLTVECPTCQHPLQVDPMKTTVKCMSCSQVSSIPLIDGVATCKHCQGRIPADAGTCPRCFAQLRLVDVPVAPKRPPTARVVNASTIPAQPPPASFGSVFKTVLYVVLALIVIGLLIFGVIFIGGVISGFTG